MSAKVILLAASAGYSGVIQAALFDRGGGLIYDDFLNVTWLQDANYVKTSGYSSNTQGYNNTGMLSQIEAQNWVGNLVYAGYDDWRLPTFLKPVLTSICTGQNCVDSELGSLFHNSLGGVAGVHYPQTTPFINLQNNEYWLIPEPNQSYWAYYSFSFEYGTQTQPGAYEPFFYVLPVRNGDVATVPAPSAIWLFGSGLGLIAFTRRKNHLYFLLKHSI
jgi:hypothetical protein